MLLETLGLSAKRLCDKGDQRQKTEDVISMDKEAYELLDYALSQVAAHY
jgi:hypothetical protein